MRPIDADAFLGWIDVGHLRNPGEICFCEADVANMIKSRPTIDPIRAAGGCYCRECKFANIRDDVDEDFYECSQNGVTVFCHGGHFCGYSKPMEAQEDG